MASVESEAVGGGPGLCRTAAGRKKREVLVLLPEGSDSNRVVSRVTAIGHNLTASGSGQANESWRKSRVQSITRSAERVTGCNLPFLQDLLASRTLKRGE